MDEESLPVAYLGFDIGGCENFTAMPTFVGHAHLSMCTIKKKTLALHKSQPSFNADGLQGVLVSSY